MGCAGKGREGDGIVPTSHLHIGNQDPSGSQRAITVYIVIMVFQRYNHLRKYSIQVFLTKSADRFAGLSVFMGTKIRIFEIS